jgi:hypothetical protein
LLLAHSVLVVHGVHAPPPVLPVPVVALVLATELEAELELVAADEEGVPVAWHCAGGGTHCNAVRSQ